MNNELKNQITSNRINALEEGLLELQKSFYTEVNAIKLCFLINGGAALAVLAFTGQISLIAFPNFIDIEKLN